MPCFMGGGGTSLASGLPWHASAAHHLPCPSGLPCWTRSAAYCTATMLHDQSPWAVRTCVHAASTHSSLPARHRIHTHEEQLAPVLGISSCRLPLAQRLMRRPEGRHDRACPPRQTPATPQCWHSSALRPPPKPGACAPPRAHLQVPIGCGCDANTRQTARRRTAGGGSTTGSPSESFSKKPSSSFSLSRVCFLATRRLACRPKHIQSQEQQARHPARVLSERGSTRL